MELKPEHELLLTCARVVLSPAHRERLDRLLQQPVCWELVAREANAQGITSLVDRHLTPVVRQICPAAVWKAWNWESLGILANNLRLVAELSALGGLLREAGIPFLCLKGPVLTAACYGDLRLRPSCDLDLLVRPADVDRAREQFVRRGFQPQFDLTGSPWKTFLRTRSELAFQREAPKALAELHWGLLSPGYSFTPSVESLWERAETVNVASFPVATLGPEDNFLFLCLHIAKHDWQRLIWLVDLAELIRQRSDMDWDLVLNAANLRSGGRQIQISLRLASQLLEAPVPAEIWHRLGADRIADRIVQRVIDQQILARAPVAGNTRTQPWQQFYFQAMPLRRDRFRFLYEVLLQPTPIEWTLLPLPCWLAPVYFVFRPIRLLYRHLLRRLRSV